MGATTPTTIASSMGGVRRIIGAMHATAATFDAATARPISPATGVRWRREVGRRWRAPPTPARAERPVRDARATRAPNSRRWGPPRLRPPPCSFRRDRCSAWRSRATRVSVFVSKLIEAGVSPMAIRWALLKRPYCQEYMWLRNETDIAQTELDALKVKLGRDSVPATDNLIKAIYDFLADDLKSADAIAAINNWVGTDGHGGDANQLRAVIDGLLGIALSA